MKACFFIFLLRLFSLAVSRRCDDFDQVTMDQLAQDDMCRAHKVGMLDTTPTRIFWIVNGLCCFIGGLSIRLHLTTMAAEIEAVRAAARVEQDEEFTDLLRRVELYVTQKDQEAVSLEEEAFLARRKELDSQKEEEEEPEIVFKAESKRTTRCALLKVQ